jgi:hypothetical protein
MRTPKDWGQSCPNPACAHYRRMQQGDASAMATYLTPSGKRHIMRCHTCATHFTYPLPLGGPWGRGTRAEARPNYG